MSQVNTCHSVLFPPPIWQVYVIGYNRQMFPWPVRSYSPQLDYLASRRVELYSNVPHPSHLSGCQMWTSLEHKIYRLDKQTDFMIIVYCVTLTDRRWEKDTCRIFLQFRPLNDVRGTLAYLLTYLLHGAESLKS
jgi:hypothetical protein